MMRAHTDELEAELELRAENARLKLEAELEQLREKNGQLKQALAKFESRQNQQQNITKIGLTSPEEQPKPESPSRKRSEEHPTGRGNAGIHLDLLDAKLPLTPFLDYTPQFATNRVFHSDEEVVEHLRSVGRRYHTHLIKIRSKKNVITGRVASRWLACERASHSKTQAKNEEKTHSTKKCGCPFLIKIYLDDGAGWKLEMLNGLHNHDGGENVHAHCSEGKLTKHELQTVTEMSEAKASPDKYLLSSTRTRIIPPEVPPLGTYTMQDTRSRKRQMGIDL